MKNSLILTVAVAGVFALVVGAQAGSPKGDQWAENHQKVSGTTPDMLDRLVKTGSPKAQAFAEGHRTVVGTRQDVDYVHATRPRLSPKDSRFETAWRENAVNEYQIAPLK